MRVKHCLRVGLVPNIAFRADGRVGPPEEDRLKLLTYQLTRNSVCDTRRAPTVDNFLAGLLF